MNGRQVVGAKGLRVDNAVLLPLPQTGVRGGFCGVLPFAVVWSGLVRGDIVDSHGYRATSSHTHFPLASPNRPCRLPQTVDVVSPADRRYALRSPKPHQALGAPPTTHPPIKHRIALARRSLVMTRLAVLRGRF